MASFHHLPAPLATVSAPLSTEAVRAGRLAVLCFPICLILLWIAVLTAGDGYVDGLGNPIGGDFAMFYVAGQMAADGEWNSLYDEALQQKRLLELMPSLPRDTYLPFRYPPLVAIGAAALAGCPYLTAFVIYSCLSLASWCGSIYLLSRSIKPQWNTAAGTAVLAIAAAPVAVQTLIDGQASMMWFAIAAGCWMCLQRKRYAAAGCLLALAACKPNVMLLLGLVLALRYPRLLLGLLPTGLLMFVVTVVVAGTEPLAAYIELGRQLAWKPWLVETPFWKVQSLLSWTQPLLGSAARRVNGLVGLTAAVAIALWWRRQPSSSANDVRALCAALIINALFNPYTPVYDLTLLCLGLLALCAHAVSHNALDGWLARHDVRCTAGLLLLGPVLSQGLARATECPLQAMPIGLLAAGVYWLVRTRGRQTQLVSTAALA